MKKLSTIFLLVLFVSVNSYSQLYTWQLKQSGTNIGNPVYAYKNGSDAVLYGSQNRIYKSWNKGDSFVQIGTNIPSATQVKNIIASEKDTNTILVAINIGSTYQIVKTSNRGQTWTVSGNFTFSYYGIAMTVDPMHPDTVYTMDGQQFKVSYNLGDTWVNKNNPGTNSAPCDIEVFPDMPNIILVGDNGTGIFRTTDYGNTWANVHVTGGEIPTMACSNVKNGLAWATKWGSGGGFLKTTDYGATWVALPYFAGKNMWGVDVSQQMSHYVITGEYSGGRNYISRDEGLTWQITTTSGSNYSVTVIDTFNVFTAQSNGFYKLVTPAPPTPVELSSFTANVVNNTVTLNWVTATELNNKGFEIERSADNNNYTKIAFVAGFGTTSETHYYNFNDEVNATGKFYYRLNQVDLDGTSEYSSVIETEVISPAVFSLEQNYPNPFNPETKIKFMIPSDARVKISVFDLLGREAAVLVNGQFGKGANEVNFKSGSLASGTYLYRIEAVTSDGTNFSEVKKLTILK